MDVRFDDADLERLERDANFAANRGEAIVTAFRRRIQAIRAASNEQDLRAMKSFHFEKLSGNRRHQHSIRLNKQFRLILELEVSGSRKVVVVKAIEDYH